MNLFYFSVHDESAALGLVNLSKKYENLFVVCFAPLTNIALAMKVDPKFAHRIKGFYLIKLLTYRLFVFIIINPAIWVLVGF